MAHYVYRFINKENEIIYVGRTSTSMKQRMGQHFGKEGHLPSECYRNVDKIEHVSFSTKTESMIIEMYLINTYKPHYNQDHKEYKKINLAIDFEQKWKEYKFEKPEEKEIKKKNETIFELRMEIQKLKEEKWDLKSTIKNLEERNKELNNTMILKHKEIELSNRPILKTDFKLESRHMEKILANDEFKDIVFTGEIIVNDNLSERIIIKKENGLIVYNFEVAQKSLTKEILENISTYMKYFDENKNLHMINCVGFNIVSDNENIIHRIKEYLNNDGYEMAS